VPRPCTLERRRWARPPSSASGARFRSRGAARRARLWMVWAAPSPIDPRFRLGQGRHRLGLPNTHFHFGQGSRGARTGRPRTPGEATRSQRRPKEPTPAEAAEGKGGRVNEKAWSAEPVTRRGRRSLLVALPAVGCPRQQPRRLRRVLWGKLSA
jgi:hypothetical protein